jgi:hypothetical protein
MVQRPRAVTDRGSILQREGHVPFRRVDCIFERFSPRERRGYRGGKRAARAMNAADSDSRCVKLAEIMTVIKNVGCIPILDLVGARDGGAPAFYQGCSRTENY